MTYSHKIAAPVVRKPSTWKVAYADTDTGEWITDDGREHVLGAFPHLAHILYFALYEGVQMVYLTGSMPGIEEQRGTKGSFENWVLSDAVVSEWHDEQTHYGDVQLAASKAFANPVIRKRSKATGERVELHRAFAWFGGEPCKPKQMREAMQQLASMLSEKWSTAERQEIITLQATPNQTGRRLWEQWLNSKGKKPDDYPPLPEETRRLIQSNSGQGRFEMCTLPDLQEIEGLYCLDGRFMYAASLNGLPCGTLLHDDKSEFLPNVRGRYRVRYEVPADWKHLGLLMTKEGADKWTYPAAPGVTAETWSSWTELQLAINKGWKVEIRERLLWLEAAQKDGPASPLETWGKRLVELYMTEGIPRLVKIAIRNIVLTTIGGFMAKQRIRTYVGDINDPAFVETVKKAEDVKETPSGRYTCEVPIEMTPRQILFAHPEWCADIWGRCRTRMLHYDKKRGRGEIVASWGALDVPRERVIAIRSDALWLSYNPEWQDDGMPGSMRLKECIARPVTAPHSEEQLRSLLSREVDKSNGK